MKKSDDGIPENFRLSDGYLQGNPYSFTNIFYWKCRFGKLKEADYPKDSKSKDRNRDEKGESKNNLFGHNEFTGLMGLSCNVLSPVGRLSIYL
jgi:hypothetical protein